MSTYPTNVFKISEDGKTEAYFKNLTSDAQLIKLNRHPQRGTTAGYSIGGKINWPISVGAFGNNIEKFPFAQTSGSASDVGEISKGFSYHKAFQSDTHAYLVEGDVSHPPVRNRTGFEKFPFAVPVATSTTLSYASMGISAPPGTPSSDTSEASGRTKVVSEETKAYFIQNTPEPVGEQPVHGQYMIFNPADPVFQTGGGIQQDQIAYKFSYASDTIALIPGTHTILYGSNTEIANTSGGPTPFGSGDDTDSFNLNGMAWIGETAAYFSGDNDGSNDPVTLHTPGYFITEMPFASEAFSVATTQYVNSPNIPTPTKHDSSIAKNPNNFYVNSTASSPTDGYYVSPLPAVGNFTWQKWPFSSYITHAEVAEFVDSASRIGFSSGTSTTDVYTTGGKSDSPSTPNPPNNTFDTIEKFPFARTSTGSMTDVGELINTLYFATMAVD